MNQLQKLQLDDKVIEGDIEFSFDLAAGIQSGKPPKVTSVAFDGSMTNASVQNLPMRHNLEQADTVLTYQEGEVHISGSGVLDGVQTDFAYQRSQDGTMSLNPKTANEQAVVSYLQDRFNLPVDGAMRLKVSVSGQPQQAKFKLASVQTQRKPLCPSPLLTGQSCLVRRRQRICS